MAPDVRLIAVAMLTFVTTYWLHSTLLLAATWIFVRACRVRSEVLRECLWKTAAVLTLITAPLELTFHHSQPIAQIALDRLCGTGAPAVMNNGAELTEPSPTWAGPVQVAPVVTVTQAPPKKPLDVGPLPIAVTHTGLEVAEQSLLVPRPASRPSLPKPPWPVALAWAAGLVGLFLGGGVVRMAGQSLCFHRRLRSARVAGSPLREMLADVLRRMKVARRVRLLSSASCGQPAAFGLFRWTIVLPEQGVQELAEDELAALFAHEIAHLVRGDARWLWICRLLCSCFSFQPLNFVVRKELRKSAEILCDEWAVRRSVNPFALARCLTRVAEWDQRSLPWSEVLAATSGRSSLADRVERLVAGAAVDDPWNTQRRRRMLGAAALAVAFIFASFAPQTALTAEPNERPSDRPSDRPSERDASPTLPVPKPSATLDESVDLLEQEVGRLKRELRGVDRLLERAHDDPELRDWHQRLRARTATLLNCETRLAALCRARTAATERSDASP
jgi:beta-lactamase regulating signal transducer with metallopeptidase domain